MAVNYSTRLPDGTVVQWVIDSVQDSFGPSGLSAPQRYKRVNFRTYLNDSSFVEVPLQPGWVDAAIAAIDEHVQELYALKAAHGPEVQ